MPRKKPRNPLKRKSVEYNQDPDAVKTKKKKKTVNPRIEEEEKLGGKTPKEFQRLLNMSKKEPTKAQTSEPERGRKLPKKANEKKPEAGSTTAEELKIQPGEKMADFVRRVDQALPLVKARSGSPSRADKKRQRQRERALRQAEQRRKEKGTDDVEEEMLQQQEQKVSKRSPSPDPWAHLEARDVKPKFNEVSSKPPELKAPTKLMKNVPKAAGSMARRDMLEQERNRFIERYRALMEHKRGDVRLNLNNSQDDQDADDD
jgi:hypothetical protein